jgi:hypothetical protein
VSNDPNEGCTGIVMSCACVIGNKKTKWKRLKVLRGLDDKQVSFLWKSLLFPQS